MRVRGTTALSALATWLLLVGGTAVLVQAVARSRPIEEEGTIVRSFFPVFSDKHSQILGDHEMFFFNVSSVSGDEEVSKARLHLHRRRMSKLPPQTRDRQLLPAPSRVVLYQARSLEARPRRLAALPVSSRSPGGWVPLDVTAALRELHGRPLLLGVRFEGPKGVKLTVNNFLKYSKSKKSKSSLAYLIVLSKSDLEEGLDGPKERHLKHKERKLDHNETPNEIGTVSSLAEVRHRSKHKVYEVRRSKEAEQELRRRTHLQSLPFLHVNEVADMRRSLRKAKRSIEMGPENVLRSEMTLQPGKHTHSNYKQVKGISSKKAGGCQRNQHPLFSSVWSISSSSVDGSQTCGGHCILYDYQTFQESDTTGRNINEGCCRKIREVPLTVVMADEANDLALYKLPGKDDQDCFCVPCD